MNSAALRATIANPFRPVLRKTQMRRWLARVTGRKFLHFLHLGKTGGSAVKFALAGRPMGAARVILLHEHDVTLPQIPQGEQVFFFVRDPISRFVSSFYSRQRQGRPRIYSPWTPQEAISFQRFSTANELAEALSASTRERREEAIHAMRSIRHVNMSYWYWFRDEEYFRSRLDDIYFVGFQESLAADFGAFVKHCGMKKHARLPTNSVAAHRTPDHADKRLSELAKGNLRTWYRTDFHFVELCRSAVKNLPRI